MDIERQPQTHGTGHQTNPAQYPGHGQQGQYPGQGQQGQYPGMVNKVNTQDLRSISQEGHMDIMT